MLTEEEVYNGAKRWLRKNGFTILAGQPARGIDHLPVIEIKQPTGNKGSKDAYKPDLVAYNNGIFYIIECKPSFDTGDNEKIVEILSSPIRLKYFFTELDQYQLLKRIQYYKSFDDFSSSVQGVLAYSGDIGPECSLHKLIVETWQGSANWIK